MSLCENKLTLTEVLRAQETDRQSRMERLKQLEALRKNSNVRQQQISTTDESVDTNSERPTRRSLRTSFLQVQRLERRPRLNETTSAAVAKTPSSIESNRSGLSYQSEGQKSKISNCELNTAQVNSSETDFQSGRGNIELLKNNVSVDGTAQGARKKTFVPKPFTINDSNVPANSLLDKCVDNIPPTTTTTSDTCLPQDNSFHDNREVEDSYEEEDLEEFKSKLLGNVPLLPSNEMHSNGMQTNLSSHDRYRLGHFRSLGHVENQDYPAEKISSVLNKNVMPRPHLHKDYGENDYSYVTKIVSVTSPRSAEKSSRNEFNTSSVEKGPLFTKRTYSNLATDERNQEYSSSRYTDNFLKGDRSIHDEERSQTSTSLRDKLRSRQWNTFHYSPNTSVADSVSESAQSRLDEIFNRRKQRIEESKKFIENLHSRQVHVPVSKVSSYNPFDKENVNIGLDLSFPLYTPKIVPLSFDDASESDTAYASQQSYDYDGNFSDKQTSQNGINLKETSTDDDLKTYVLNKSVKKAVSVSEFTTESGDEHQQEKLTENYENEVKNKEEEDDQEEENSERNNDDSEDHHEDVTVIEPQSFQQTENRSLSLFSRYPRVSDNQEGTIVNRMLYGSSQFTSDSFPEKELGYQSYSSQIGSHRGCCTVSTQTECVVIGKNAAVCEQGVQVMPNSQDFCVQVKMTDKQRDINSTDKILIGRIRKRSIKSAGNGPVVKKRENGTADDYTGYQGINGTKRNGNSPPGIEQMASTETSDKDDDCKSAFKAVAAKIESVKPSRIETPRKSLSRSKTVSNTPPRPKSAQGMEADRELSVVSPTPSLRSLTSTPTSVRKERKKSKSSDKKLDRESKRRHASNESGLSDISVNSDLPSFARPTLSNLQKTRKSIPRRKSQPNLKDALFSSTTPTKDFVEGKKEEPDSKELKVPFSERQISDSSSYTGDDVFTHLNTEESTTPESELSPPVPSCEPPANVICPTPSYGSIQNISMGNTIGDDQHRKVPSDKTVMVDKIIHKANALENTLNRVCSVAAEDRGIKDNNCAVMSKNVDGSPTTGERLNLLSSCPDKNFQDTTLEDMSKQEKLQNGHKKSGENVAAKSPTSPKWLDSRRKQTEAARLPLVMNTRMNKSKLTSSFPKLSPTRLSRARPLEHCLSDEELREPIAPYQPTFASQDEVAITKTSHQKDNKKNRPQIQQTKHEQKMHNVIGEQVKSASECKSELATTKARQGLLDENSSAGTNGSSLSIHNEADTVEKVAENFGTRQYNKNDTTQSKPSVGGKKKNKPEKKKKSGHRINFPLFQSKKSK